MRRNFIVLALLAATPLAACATLPSAPSVTISVERAKDLEVAYTTASRLGAALVKAGVLNREAFQAADRAAYAGLTRARACYGTPCKATIDDAFRAVAALGSLTDGPR